MLLVSGRVGVFGSLPKRFQRLPSVTSRAALDVHATIANQQDLEMVALCCKVESPANIYTQNEQMSPFYWDYFKRRWIIFQPSILRGCSLVFRVMLLYVTSTMAFNRCRSQWWGKLGQKDSESSFWQGGTCWFVAAWMLSSLMCVIGVTGTRRPLKPDSRGDWSLPSKSWEGRCPWFWTSFFGSENDDNHRKRPNGSAVCWETFSLATLKLIPWIMRIFMYMYHFPSQ